ncbi:hypothetical protein SteCoe_4534 [Stentor coeruleus]|uniref:Calcium-dependent protein kinase 1 n=1 Tax=Stentor coeruleus TaxID=5963 RepID=A0A1R2CUL7_9CILI|nr:hypothetical protein SteCoe_4534 [Stentor coeruleus]
MEIFKVSAYDFVSEKHCQMSDNYEVKEALGEGSFGSVRKVTHRLTQEDRAVKILHKKKLNSSSNMQSILNEVNILRNLDHPNILRVYECYQDKFCYCIVTELCTGGELFEKITKTQRLSESLCADYIRQILSCLLYMHEKDIVHRDIKPENFLLDNNGTTANLKLIDFGSATFITKGKNLTHQIGTSYYIAPEVLEKNYNEKCDIWSAGVILYVMLSGTPPFTGKNDIEIFKKIKKGTYELKSSIWNNVSKPAKDLLQKLLNVNKNQRLSAREALRHPWLRSAIDHPIDRSHSERFINNLQSFHPHKKLQQLTLAFIASHLTRKAEQEEMLELFKKLDLDNSGSLSKQDIKNGISQFKYVSDKEVDEIMNEVDIDESGEIGYSEFLTACFSRRNLLSRQKLELAFKEYDVSNCGVIRKEDLKEVLGHDHYYDDSIWQSMIEEADKNRDGVVDIDEFSDMMLSLLVK